MHEVGSHAFGDLSRRYRQRDGEVQEHQALPTLDGDLPVPQMLAGIGVDRATARVAGG